MEGADLFYSYFTAARWTIAQISGRTDIVLRTTPEYTYTCVVCVFGLIIMSLIIGFVTNALIELGNPQRESNNLLRHLGHYMKRNSVSVRHSHRAKVLLSAQLRWLSERKMDKAVLDMLPKPLLMDIFYEIRSPIIEAHPFFADISREFPRVVSKVCCE